MAPLEQHVRDCVRFLGEGFSEVHLWLDQYMAALGGHHRRVLHHVEGIEQAGRTFGIDGKRAAIIHVLRDCRRIPRRAEYENGVADALGLRREWSVAACATYTEEAFDALVNHQLNGPSGTLLWGFVSGQRESLERLWSGLISAEQPPLQLDFDSWERAKESQKSLPNLEPLLEEEIRPLEGQALQEITRLSHEQPSFRQSIQTMLAQGIQFGFFWLPINKLICPIALIDSEHIEQLRAELSGDDDTSLVQFAFHGGAAAEFKAATQGRNLVLSSRHLGTTLSAPRIEFDSSGGMSIRIDVGTVAEFVHVFIVGDRAYLANGMHRCYLLASMGKSEVPCLMMTLGAPPPLESPYPTFVPEVLAKPRPPLVTDFFNEALTTRLPLQRNQKVLRVTTEEFPVPSL